MKTLEKKLYYRNLTVHLRDFQLLLRYKYLCFWEKRHKGTDLIVEEDPNNGRHHAHDVGEGDGVAQHEQWNADNHDPLGGVGDGVAERADEVEHAEGYDVLSKVTETTDQQQKERPSWEVRLEEITDKMKVKEV